MQLVSIFPYHDFQDSGKMPSVGIHPYPDFGLLSAVYGVSGDRDYAGEVMERRTEYAHKDDALSIQSADHGFIFRQYEFITPHLRSNRCSFGDCARRRLNPVRRGEV